MKKQILLLVITLLTSVEAFAQQWDSHSFDSGSIKRSITIAINGEVMKIEEKSVTNSPVWKTESVTVSLAALSSSRMEVGQSVTIFCKDSNTDCISFQADGVGVTSEPYHTRNSRSSYEIYYSSDEMANRAAERLKSLIEAASPPPGKETGNSTKENIAKSEDKPVTPTKDKNPLRTSSSSRRDVTKTSPPPKKKLPVKKPLPPCSNNQPPPCAGKAN